MRTKTLARIGVIAFVAVAITATAIEMRGPPQAVEAQVAPPPVAADADRLRDELARCQAIGLAGASDDACLRAWKENRRRFFALDAAPRETMPGIGDDAAENADEATPSNGVATIAAPTGVPLGVAH